ncbi:MAG TPA: helix-turn-helix transcriptional regulator [Candidatus Udaeobacter sp.]|jgi:transcriptional regulator with XRE-family HTH domain
MKTIEQVHEQIQAALKAARETHEYRAEGASIEFTNAMVTRMREARVSRSELARMIKTTPAYISKILRGATNFSLDSMVKIANALNCELRLHLQPSGAKSQWLDVYTSKTLKMSFEPSGVPENIIHPMCFKPVELPLEISRTDERRAVLA